LWVRKGTESKGVRNFGKYKKKEKWRVLKMIRYVIPMNDGEDVFNRLAAATNFLSKKKRKNGVSVLIIWEEEKLFTPFTENFFYWKSIFSFFFFLNGTQTQQRERKKVKRRTAFCHRCQSVRE
jgi:hypothetical protein